MRRKKLVLGALGIAMLAIGPTLEAQTTPSLPLLPTKPSGSGISPVYEGWYRNADGSYTLSFGYINRNREVIVDLPVGENNFVEPAQFNGQQPTRFETFRHYGWFTVNVPSDFGSNEVVWTIDHNGQRFAIPARIQDGYEIDALRAPATGMTPPILQINGSDEARSPSGVYGAPLTARVGQGLPLEVRARDESADLTIRWYKYQGPGEVTFSEQSQNIPQAGGVVRTEATFSAPGEYIVYARANNGPLVSSGQEQCCWTNGYVKISVTQ